MKPLKELKGRFFPTQEIGSIAKPNWAVKKLRNQTLCKEDGQEFNYWSKLLDVVPKKQYAKLLAKKNLNDKEKQKIRELASIFAIKLQEVPGLDIVYNGEQMRSEMYQYPIKYCNGFQYYGAVRSWDNKYYLKAACIDKPSLMKPYHLEEYSFVKKNTDKIVKVPITGAYTLADWSYNEYYTLKWKKKLRNPKKIKYNAKRELTLDIAKNIIKPNIKALLRKGAKIIQIDEPAATTYPEEVPIFIESFNESVKGLDGKFSVHICFSDYSCLFPELLELKKCSQFPWEFANRDNTHQDGYETLKLFKQYKDKREIGLGVLDVHRNEIEKPDTVRDRILYACKILEEPERIYVNPDCGLRTRSWQVVFEKLSSMVVGTELARAKFEL